LTPVGRKVGLVADEHWMQFEQRRERLASVHRLIVGQRVDTKHSFFTSRQMEFRDRPSVASLLRRPEVHLEELIVEGVLARGSLRREDIASLETEIKYEGYLRQQQREVEKLRKAEQKRIPEDMDYSSMPGLSREIVEKLSRVRPASIAQASRIPGVTPASLTILLFHLEMRRDSVQAPSR
jgi:tRNA uridine 5-carboxymethylaminomethyl modification enzyme